jgi:hypothetical protein
MQMDGTGEHHLLQLARLIEGQKSFVFPHMWFMALKQIQ